MRSIEFQILLALAAGVRHGYAILRDIEARREAGVETGTLYRALQRLLEQKCVRETKGPPGEDERRRFYAITSHGRRALVEEARRMAALVAAARAIRIIPS
ncbi:MAG: helix-turn-helix transcriptional regulator [Gemmatimonadota bacterium]